MIRTIFFILSLGLFMFYSCGPVTTSQETPPKAKVDTTFIKEKEAGIDTLKKDIYVDPVHLRYENFVYRDFIKTVTFHQKGLSLSQPVIHLNGKTELTFSFDDLEGGVKEYFYTIIHCDADWIPSELNTFEYIEGFAENQLYNYHFSFNTLEEFTHYKLTFPNDDMRPVKSGNYILMVYLNNDPEQVVLTRRFLVVDSTPVMIEAEVKRPSVVKYRNSHQEVDYLIRFSKMEVSNPFEEISTVILQNNNWNTAITGLKPVFVQNNELSFDLQTGNLFPAGKEYRRFDFRSFRYYSEYVKEIEVINRENHVFLFPDKIRSYQQYVIDEDYNGKYFIDVQEGNNPDIEADYAYVHFTLPMNSPATEGSLYIVGELNDWKLLKEYRLDYNYNSKAYEADVYLKQGYYEYEYVFVHDEQERPDKGLIEGNYFEAENSYTILVYYRPFGERYDQLIGIKKVNSIK